MFSQENRYNSIESDPAETGYMRGFPPPIDKRINARDGSFFKFPALRYSVVHMREFMPTVNVPRGNRQPPIEFSRAIDENIDSIKFLPTGSITPKINHTLTFKHQKLWQAEED